MHTRGSQMTEASPRLRRAWSSELLGSDGDKLRGWGERRKPTLLCREHLSVSADHSYPQSISSLVSRLSLLQRVLRVSFQMKISFWKELAFQSHA